MSSCQNCTPQQNCGCNISFKTDGSYLAPYIGGAPIEPIDLSSLVLETETDTRLQLDIANKTLVYTGEKAQNGGTPDAITIESIASLIGLNDLEDVEYGFASNGDLLIYDTTTNKWVSYTIPGGTIVSTMGVDVNGKIVKALAAAPLPGSVEIPIGGSMLWTLPEGALPSNFLPMDGREISRTVYAAYFALVGTTYGPGNNTTTFNIPNMKGRIPVGMNTGEVEFAALGQTGGNKYNNLNHGHTVNPHSHFDGNVNTNFTSNNHSHGGIVRGGSFSDGQTPDHAHLYSRATGVSAPGTDGALSSTTSNMQPYMSVIWALRVQ